jgi:S-adenosylmethionine:tRNA ribosyltransferase-isomerase
MLVSDFDFDLPEDRIALRPVSPKDSAKQLIVRPNGEFEDRTVRDMIDFLKPEDVIVFNDTKVIPAQLFGVRNQDKKFQCNLHKRISLNEWIAFAPGVKRMKIGDQIAFGDGALNAIISNISHDDQIGQITLKFDIGAGELDSKLHMVGMMPLPPYIAAKRGIDADDANDYQTIFAAREGAVAAPTASLHFTPELLENIDKIGMRRVTLTLHVGAGTFLPVKVDDTKDHKMHAEWGEITNETAQILNDCHACGGRIIAVGTTVLRLLESATDEQGIIRPFIGDTDIFITPGYKFRAVDILMTNFHLPKSTLFMLVSAFAGFERMRDAYQYAIDHKYRFYSYGDSSLLFRAK